VPTTRGTEQTTQDLLFALPARSYDGVERAAGSASLTLRADAAGLDALLFSPLAAAVAAAVNPDMQRLAGGNTQSLFLKTDGSLWAWGNNGYGELGDGTTNQLSTPVQVLTGVAAVAAGDSYTLAIKTDGSLWAWGHNGYGELGDGTTTQRLRPVPVAGFVGPTAPDFVVTGVTLNPLDPLANSTFSATVTVKNQGTASGRGGYLDVWADQPTAQTCRADGDTFVSVGTLAAGASTTLTVDGLLGGAAGTKTLRAFVDSYCGTRETREGNNQKTAVYSVGP
jgi:hypothetical protein